MDLLWGVGPTVIAVILLLQALALLISTNRLLKLQLWVPRKTPCVRAASGDLLPLFDAARAEMEQAGFRYMHSWRGRSMVAAENIPVSYSDVYHHLAQDVHAEVVPAEAPGDKRLYNIHLWNTYIDGKALLTVNGLQQALVPFPTRVSVIADKSPDLAGQLATHLHVRELITVQRTDLEDAPKIAQNLVDRWLVRLEREGKVYQRTQRGDEIIYGFRFLPALKMAWNMRKVRQNTASNSARQTTATGAKSSATAESILAARQLRDRHTFIRTVCTLRSMLAPRWYQYASFTLSALAFLTLGAWWWGITGALLIGAVIAVHEGGHWLAMKLAGFRDVQVFFVPGMGGITSGEKHEAKPLTHMLVYLAGPMPGLLLSLASFALIAWEPGIMNTTWGPYLTMAALASLLVNGFNLLPILPLDGGRIIELLLIARLPWLRFIFSLASGLMMLGYGLYSNDKVLLGLGIVVLITARFQFKLAKAAALLLRQKARPASNQGFANAAGELFDFFDQASFSTWNFATRLEVGQSLLSRYLGGLPGWRDSSAGIALYLACLVLPIASLLALFYTAPTTMLSLAGQGLSGLMASTDAVQPLSLARSDVKAATKVDASSWEDERKLRRTARAEKITAAQGEDRVRLLKDALEEASESDAEDALRIARIYYAENNNSVQATYFHADAAFAMANALRNWSEQDEVENTARNEADIANYLQEAEAILRARLHTQADKNDAHLLAEVLQAKDMDADNPAQLLLKQEIVSLFGKEKAQDDTQLLQAHQMLARSYYISGKADEAAQELQLAENDYDCATKKNDDYLCQSLKLDQAWLLVGKKKFDEAIKLLTPYNITAKNHHQNNTMNRENHQLKWMIAMLKKDYVQASKEAQSLTKLQLPGTGNWLVDFFIQRARPASNYQADLMLVESLRARGEQDEANKITERLLDSQKKIRGEVANTKPGNTESICRINSYGSAWKAPFQQTLLNVEQRETRCLPRLNTSQMSR